jgi:glycosyltransferase involved in cell wall biosynthesis
MTQHHDKPVLGYILKGYPRISETFISNEILLLEKMGFTLRLFPMRKPRENFCHASVKKIQARVDYLPTELFENFSTLLYHNIFLAVQKPANFLRALASCRESTEGRGNLASLKHLFQGGYLAHAFLTEDANIVHLHGHFAHSPTSVTLFSSLLSGIPFSFTAHAKDIYTSAEKKLKRKIEQAEFVTTCTAYNEKYLKNIAGDSSTPIFRIYHGIDISLFRQTEARVKTIPPFQLMTVARMTEKKGLPVLYEALKILKNRGVEFQHTLIGDGDDRKKILNLISALDLNSCCRWLGTRTHEEVIGQFAESDAFVLPCKIAGNGDRDGIPNVLVESLAMGVPALSTDISAIPEILLHEKTGLTVPSSRPDLLAEAIKRILTDTGLRETLIRNGRKFVEMEFNNKTWVEKLGKTFLRENRELRLSTQPAELN